MNPTKKQQLETINIILDLNKKMGGRNPAACMALTTDNKTFAVIQSKLNDDEFIPAIIQAIKDEKDCTAEILSAISLDYGYAIELKVKITQGGDSYTDTFEGVYCCTY